MSSDNFTVQIGNLTDDPELRFINNGIAVANFNLAVNTRVRESVSTLLNRRTEAQRSLRCHCRSSSPLFPSSCASSLSRRLWREPLALPVLASAARSISSTRK
jgi:hypothetical protein